MFWQIIIVLLGIVCLASCNKLHDGTVIKMHIEPERTYTYLMPIYHRIGKVTTVTYIPIIRHDDEDYVITIDGFTEEDHEERIEDFYVSKAKYECIKVGDHFYIDKDCSDSPNDDVEVSR